LRSRPLIVACSFNVICVSNVSVGTDVGMDVGCPVGGFVSPARVGRGVGGCV